MKGLNKIIGFFIITLLSLSPIDGEDYLPITGIGQFYRTSTGTVAFIPYAKNREEARKNKKFFYVLPKSGVYTLKKQSSYWFIVNHKTSEKPEETYLGVEIIPIYPEKISPNAQVFLRRNKGWLRLQDPDFNGEANVYKKFETKKISEFLIFHKIDSKLSIMDREFGFK
jgi:hypothetical protein